MKALTIQQPWAWAILHGGKMVENRTWPTSYRGPLVIHAGKSTAWMDRENPLAWPHRYGVALPQRGDLTFGALLGTVYLVDCLPVHKLTDEHNPIRGFSGNKFIEGPVCWLLDNMRPFAKPIPWKGAQGLWDVPEDIITKALAGSHEHLHV